MNVPAPTEADLRRDGAIEYGFLVTVMPSHNERDKSSCELIMAWIRRAVAAEAAIVSERVEWNKMFGIKHPEGEPLSARDARLMKAIFSTD